MFFRTTGEENKKKKKKKSVKIPAEEKQKYCKESESIAANVSCLFLFGTVTDQNLSHPNDSFEKGEGREDNRKILMTQTSFLFLPTLSGRIKNPAGN